MSKKRDKNARKKAVQKKRSAAPSGGDVPIDKPPPSVLPDWEEQYQDPEVAPPDAGGSGGAIGALRSMVSPGKGRDGDTLLTKRRSVPELMVWLAGAIAIGWGLWTLYRSFKVDPQ